MLFWHPKTSRQSNSEKYPDLHPFAEFKDKKHIFIFSVLGRTSSTALQRIINSSGEVTIYGEMRNTLTSLLEALHWMENYPPSIARASYQTLMKSLQSNKHNLPYPHAIDIDSGIRKTQEAIISLLKPQTLSGRSGFKEVEPINNPVLNQIKKTFPNSVIIFIFRNPLEQFSSIRSLEWWSKSQNTKNIQQFIANYTSLAETYLSYNSNHEQFSKCIENKDIYSEEKLRKLFSFLDISHFDDSLINDKVFENRKRKDLTSEESQLLEKSPAYQKYLALKERVSWN